MDLDEWAEKVLKALDATGKIKWPEKAMSETLGITPQDYRESTLRSIKQSLEWGLKRYRLEHPS